MRINTRILSFGILSALGLGAASASTLTTENLASLVGTVTSATDSDFLNLFTGGATGPMPTWTLSETATDPSWTNWTGSFVGQLLGTAFDLTYKGTFSGSTLSWSTSGTYGAITIAGGGSGTISYPTSSTFQLAFADTLVSRGGAYSTSGNLPGSINSDGTFQLGPGGDTEVGPLPVYYNDQLVPGADGWSYRSYPTGYYEDDWQPFGWSPIFHTMGFIDSSTTFHDSTIPEPKTFLLLGAGLLAMSIAMRKARIKALNK